MRGRGIKKLDVFDTQEKRPARAGLEVGPVLAWGPGPEVRALGHPGPSATEE
jgi:hypothetical protein